MSSQKSIKFKKNFFSSRSKKPLLNQNFWYNRTCRVDSRFSITGKPIDAVIEMKKKHFIDLGKRLRKARMALGIQQNEMAKVVGVKPPYISSLENGKRSNPTIALLFDLSRHFHISLDYLLHGTGDMFLPSEESGENKDRFNTPDFDNIDFAIWLMRNSTFAKNNILGYVEKFYIENEDFIKNKLMRSKEKGQEDANDTGSDDITEKTGAEKNDENGR